MHALLLAICCTVTVHVHTPTGAPLAGAQVSLAGAKTSTKVTDNSGNVAFTAQGGSYHVDASAKGYVGVSIDLELKETAAIDVTLEPVDAPTLRTIGTVTVDGRLTPIRGTLPSVTITRADMERLGEDRVIDSLLALPGATFTRPDGGGANAIAVVSLRGPDPSESLVALDDQLLNDGNTGDLDLSRFPVAAFAAVDVTEGLGPEDSNGSNTFGGAINFVSLQPTLTPHFNFSGSVGSFGQSELWLNATGTHGRLGYAFALDNQHEGGYTTQPETRLYSRRTSRPARARARRRCSDRRSHRVSHLGTSRGPSRRMPTSTRASFCSATSAIRARRSTASTTTASDVGTTYGLFTGPGAESFLQNIRAYQVRSRAPLGAGELTADVSESDNGITIDGNPSDPAYDVTHIDHRYNGALSWQRTFATSQFAIGGYTRYESLEFLAPASTDGSTLTPSEQTPQIGQTINVFYARGGYQPAAKLRLDGGVFRVALHVVRRESRWTFGRGVQSRPQRRAAFLDRHRLPRAAADRALSIPGRRN